VKDFGRVLFYIIFKVWAVDYYTSTGFFQSEFKYVFSILVSR